MPTGIVSVTRDAQGQPTFTLRENVVRDFLEATRTISQRSTCADAFAVRIVEGVRTGYGPGLLDATMNERTLTMMTRRQALKATALASAACTTAGMLRTASAQPAPAPATAAAPTGPFTLPPLAYAFDALEPHIDARTMQIHHDKHHGAYVANLNKAVADFPAVESQPVEALLKDLNAVPEKIRTAIRNQGGGHFNHTLFWQMMKPVGGGQPAGELLKAIEKRFGSFTGFKDALTKSALGQFGSGWAWLVLDANKQLGVESTANQDSPVSQNKQPLLGIDVWEHAYYLKYQNRRPEYVAAFFNVINWDWVTERYEKALS
jgi:Fe-Mn family superoxide dismutase